MASDSTKAVAAIEHWIGHETAHLTPAEQYETFKQISRSCERMSDELLLECVDEIRAGSGSTVNGDA